MENQDKRLRIEIDDTRSFVREALDQSGRKHLFDYVDEQPKYTRVAEIIAGLAEASGAELLRPGQAGPVSPRELPALVSGKYFINVPEAAWKVIVASLPIVVAIVRAQADPIGYVQAGTGALSLAEVLRKIPKKLLPEEIPVFLAVRLLTSAGGATTSDSLAEYLRANHPDKDQWTPEKIQRIAGTLATREILKRSASGFTL